MNSSTLSTVSCAIRTSFSSTSRQKLTTFVYISGAWCSELDCRNSFSAITNAEYSSASFPSFFSTPPTRAVSSSISPARKAGASISQKGLLMYWSTKMSATTSCLFSVTRKGFMRFATSSGAY